MTAEPQRGIGVDAFGNQTIDPTANVIALVEAGLKRQDDLRDLHNRYIEAKMETVKETVKWLEKLSDVHQWHDREIHKMEQEKLAAFRASDDAARLTEANRGLAAIEVLARTTQSTADNLRSALEATTATRDSRIAALEKSSYEGAGKGTGAKNTVTYVVLAVGLVMSLITIGSVVVAIAFAIRK